MSDMPQPAQKPARVAWQDVARGIGIALVVLGHVEQGLIGSGLISQPAWHPFDFGLYTFHMPLFMFLAGLNVPRSLQAGGGRFLRSKVLGILYPYLLWSVLQGVAMAALSGLTNHRAGYDAIGRILWDPIPPFWFLYALFLFSVAARFIPARNLLALSIVVFPLGEMFYRDSFMHRLLHFPVFFVLGMYFGSRWTVPRIHAPWIALGVAVAGGTIIAGLHAAMQNYDSVWMLPAALGGTVAMLGIAQRLDSVTALVRMGRISLAIYVMHILAASGTRILLHRLLPTRNPGWLYVVTVTAAGLGIPAWVYLAAKQMKLLPWLGLQIGPRGRHWVNTGQLPNQR